MFFMPWPWGLRVVDFCLLCVVSGACFVLVCLAFWIVFGLGGWVGPGLVFWTVVLIGEGSWLAVFVVGWGSFCWFCLESLILAQDERWRRA